MQHKWPRAGFWIFRYSREFLFVCSIVFLAAVRDAHAYIDPGSGALLWQALLAACFGALFYIRSIWRVLTSWIRNLKQKAIEKHE